MLEMIRSGGQTGADFGGLLAARRLGIPPGGWAPRGWLIESADGREHISAPWLADYGLVECPMPLGNIPPNDGSKTWREFCTRAYVVRTEWNARDSDGTLWLGAGDSLGYGKTKRSCDDYERPFLSANGKKPSEIRAWLLDHEIGVLNIAGNRASKQPSPPGCPPFHDRVADFLVVTLREIINGQPTD